MPPMGRMPPHIIAAAIVPKISAVTIAPAAPMPIPFASLIPFIEKLLSQYSIQSM